MGVIFTWQESYSVGNPEIDAQHQQLFALANSLPETFDKETVARTVMGLYKYIRVHFRAEEEMMLRIGYPRVAEHVELHNALISRLEKVSPQSLSDVQSLSAFRRFVYEWVIDHIMTRDMDYFRFVQNQQRSG